MNGSIGHLHCRYRVVGTAPAAAVAARLDGVARERFAEAWERSLARMLGDDTAFYVVRAAHASVAMSATEELTDSDLAERWAAGLAGAVVQTISRERDDGEQVVRFTDRAEFVARFIGDLLSGDAGGRWFYGAFDRLRRLTLTDALRGALINEGEDLPAILGYLHQQGTLDRLLRALDEATLDLIWGRDMPGEVRVGDESSAPLIHAATGLLTSLGLWRGNGPSKADLEAAISRSAATPDWRDTRSLAMAVFDVLVILGRGGYIRRAAGTDSDFDRRLDDGLASLTWLDREWLAASIRRLVVQDQTADPLTRPLTSGATPRQRELLTDLAEALPSVASSLDRAAPRSARNAIRIYGSLVAHAPHWATDPAAESMVATILAAWETIAASPAPAATMAALAGGDSEAVLVTLPRPIVPRSAMALRQIARLGEPASRVLQALPVVTSPSVAATGWTETRCAGVLLLLRAVMDIRLPALAGEANYPPGDSLPPGEALLLAVGLRIAGDGAVTEGLIDDGLLAFAGASTPVTLEQLERASNVDEPSSRRTFQAALFEQLARQRLVNGRSLHVHRVGRRDRQAALIGGDGHVYPFGTLDGDDPPSTISGWLDTWRAAVGDDAHVVVDDSTLASALSARGARVVDLGSSGLTSADLHPSDQTELAVAHRAGDESLARALEALDGRQLGAAGFHLDTALTSISLIRAWARWLPGFAGSSVPYLLDGLLRRAGRIRRDPSGLVVELEPRALDVVLEMAGYLADVVAYPAVTGSAVRFEPGRG
ncbi:MAG: hypothetical protein L0227_15240 [Chloroflexi bacterium]|nr:hypothetical protein [Chloroflexota bacterium]